MSTFAELRRRTQTMCHTVAQSTGVSDHIVTNVIQYAKQLTHPSEPDFIDELVFLAQMGLRFGITSRFHVQLMFEALKVKSTRHVRLEDYVRTICIFASPNLDTKIDYVFNVYDFKQDGYLEYSEISSLLRTSIISAGEDNDPAEALTDLINLVLSVTDSNNDGLISHEEFRAFVKHDILCIQLLGKVFPSEANIVKFMNLMKYEPPAFIKEYFANERAICLNEPIIRVVEDKLYPGVVMDVP